MKKLFLRTVFLLSVFLAVEIFKPEAIQAQCFHLGQAFDCKGLPEGTSSDHFNPDGSITLSNGQVVPGNFFDTPFVAPAPLPLGPAPAIISPFAAPIVLQGPGPTVFLPSTIDGINSLTAFSNPFDQQGFSESVEWDWETLARIAKLLTVDENTYKGTSLTFNKRLANRWVLRGNVAWQDWTWNSSYNPSPYDPDEAVKVLFEWFMTIPKDRDNRQLTSALSYYLSTSSFGRHDIKTESINSSTFFNTGSVSHALKYGAGYKNAEVQERDYYSGETIYQPQLNIKLFQNDYILIQTPDITGLQEGPAYTFKLKDYMVLNTGESVDSSQLMFGTTDYYEAAINKAPKEGTQDFLGGIEFEVARSVSLGVRVTAGFDPKGNGDWIFNVPYNQYVTALANGQADSTGSTYNQETLIKGNLTENVGPSYSLTPDKPWGFTGYTIKDTKFLAPLIEKTVYQMDYQTAPVPEVQTKVEQPELPQAEVFTPESGHQDHKGEEM